MRISLVLLGLLGCTHGEALPVDPATRPPDVAAVAKALTPEYSDHLIAPPGLGTPCTASPLCGTKGRVAVHFENFAPPPRCTLMPLVESFQQRTSACVEAGVVKVYDTCVACRMASNTLTAGIAAELTPPQREYLRGLVGLPAAVTLETADDWQTALSRVTPAKSS